MTGDEVVSLLVCLSLLGGVLVGLRFDVRMLAWTCLFVLAVGAGLATSGTVDVGRDILMTTMTVVALQVGYFVAVVIGAMRLADAPITAGEDANARRPRREATGAPRASRA